MVDEMLQVQTLQFELSSNAGSDKAIIGSGVGALYVYRSTPQDDDHGDHRRMDDGRDDDRNDGSVVR